MSRRSLGFVVTAVGVIVVVVAAFADPIGIGGAEDTFGWKQTIGIVLGAVLVVLGIILAVRGEKPAPGGDGAG